MSYCSSSVLLLIDYHIVCHLNSLDYSILFDRTAAKTCLRKNRVAKGHEEVKWKLGLTRFFGGKMRFDHWELGFCYWEWEIKESLVRMGFALSEVIRY